MSDAGDYTVTVGRREVKTTVIRKGTMNELGPRLVEMLSGLPTYNSKRVVGLDIVPYADSVLLLKLATEESCVLVRFREGVARYLPSPLYSFLQLPDVTFVGVGISFVLKELERVFMLRCRNAVDLGMLAAAANPGGFGIREGNLLDLAPAVGIRGGIFRDPTAALDTWVDFPNMLVTREQVQHATVDVHLACIIGRQLFEPSCDVIRKYYDVDDVPESI